LSDRDAVLASVPVSRVRAALEAAGVASEIVVLPDAAHTARAAAAQLGCEVAQIANSLVFRGASTDQPVLVMASGAGPVDPARVAGFVSEPVAKAHAAFVRASTGFAIGGVAPCGHVAPLVAVLDARLFAIVWAAAGQPRTVFRLTPAELQTLTRGTVGDIAQDAR
jgi:prolyl-tRNA editing enzyme YbaK/EbsC (Cys-tRNA(Pro) deacylase)